MKGAERVWRAQHSDFNRVLCETDAVVTEDDGFQWIDPERVSQGLIDRYQRHVQVGYAKGWL